MHFNVADAEAHHLCYAVEQVAPILLLWVEETVLRSLAGSVPRSVVGDSWPLVPPPRHAAERGFNGTTHIQRFVVIGDGNPGTLRLLGMRALDRKSTRLNSSHL